MAATKQQRINELEVELFNNKTPVGSKVNLKKDGGEVIETVTTSEAYIMGGHTPVIHLQGVSGAYMLSRVTRI